MCSSQLFQELGNSSTKNLNLVSSGDLNAKVCDTNIFTQSFILVKINIYIYVHNTFKFFHAMGIKNLEEKIEFSENISLIMAKKSSVNKKKLLEMFHLSSLYFQASFQLWTDVWEFDTTAISVAELCFFQNTAITLAADSRSSYIRT